MLKYRFSQGKVWVEEGIYTPFLDSHRREGRPGVLILVAFKTQAPEVPSDTQDKEESSTQSETKQEPNR